MDTKILEIDQVHPDIQAIRQASEIIRNGGTVVFPTETVYGLGANALSGEACRKIFEAKERPRDNPLIVHISDLSELETVAIDVPLELTSILEKIWPGPITLLFKKNKAVPNEVTAGLDSVAVRMPANPVALMLIKESGVPIAAPSANIATRPSIVDSSDAKSELSGKVDMILDAGKTFFGIESTILDIRKKPAELLRPGAFEVEDLEKYFGEIHIGDTARGLKEAEIAITPGMKYRHYSPEKELYIVDNRELFKEIMSSDFAVYVTAICSNELASQIDQDAIKLGSESNLYEIASNLFQSFRKLDYAGKSIGIIQAFDEQGIGIAIMNRIRKASAGELKTIGGIESIMKQQPLKK